MKIKYDNQPDGSWKKTVEKIDPADPLVRKAEELSAANGGAPVVGWSFDNGTDSDEGVELLENL